MFYFWKRTNKEQQQTQYHQSYKIDKLEITYIP